MKVNDSHDLYLAELAELRSAEAQMAEHLGELAKRATDPALTEAIETHRDRTEEHRDRIDTLLNQHGARAADRHDDASMRAIISESGKWTGMIDDENLKDAGMIGSLQRMEHYEIAVSGTLANWARKLGHDRDVAVLSGILDQDRTTDARLSEIAEMAVNPAAL